MVVAPELFTPSKAIGALNIADAVLRAPLGMKTLDPSDSQYRGDYDNSNDSTDQAIAKGWNVSIAKRMIGTQLTAILQYHQGPEWGFPLGWFLMAYLKFDRLAGEGKSVSFTPEYLCVSVLTLFFLQNPTKTMHYISNILRNLARHIESDPWRGLPELTNSSKCSPQVVFGLPLTLTTTSTKMEASVMTPVTLRHGAQVRFSMYWRKCTRLGRIRYRKVIVKMPKMLNEL